MAEIAYLLLCHKDPGAIIAQARQLVAGGDAVAIHYDRNGEGYDQLRDAVTGDARIALVPRVRCGWGEWSLVRATLNAISTALQAFPSATHLYLISGDCQPIKSARFIQDYLDERPVDFIENHDFLESDWIRTGIKEERLVYRHYFNERAQKWLFYASLALQERMGLRRAIPADLQVRVGSQWWCLRRQTAEQVLDFIRRRRDVVRFFRTSWIPDETFFQTIVRHLVPGEEVMNRTPTFLMFSDYGMPVQFHNDHFDLLVGQDALFARKISAEALELKARLSETYTSDDAAFQIIGEGHRLHSFLTSRGRIGRRFGSRFWERESTLGRHRELMIVACKKWHVAKKLVARIRDRTGMPAVEYLFNEVEAGLPDMGGIETSLSKRMRHCRALVRMLFDHFGSDRLIVCVDPADISLLQDFYGDRARIRLLEVECQFSDSYLAGHARRIGLAGTGTPAAALAKILPTIRQDILSETDRMQDSDFPGHFHLREGAPVIENATALAEFLAISQEAAHDIATTEHLFAD
ncbi:Core-2/I-Branching enzyme [Poseidonocella pacifica]|uniref:Peptide O-xylosyltransferase n=1 Tax=Poseidonocella pacifica TaxID=871651 RepID=A0A1I0Y4W1_9RHOB|nr:DUF5928 domain-containing protein [Poseidonocella pacifica]SFB08445.1 Core-2/I-Branching enzyme [Poseidonocella pacifica]